jgi:hypothetical protein
MVRTMPYADLLAIYNAVAEKPVARSDARANGVRRTAALLEERVLTLAEAARLADVVLSGGDASQGPSSDDEAFHQPADTAASAASPNNDADMNQTGVDVGDGTVPTADRTATILVDPDIATSVEAFARELMKPARPADIAKFVRRLGAGSAAPGKTSTNREGGMTPSQRKIVELCSRPDGATGKELAEGCGWPSIAARATCQRLADRFGYFLHESPKANRRGISFRMTAKPAAEEHAS